MSGSSKPLAGLPIPANDNAKPPKLRVEVRIARNLPVQRIEVEVLSQLLESLSPANDNEAGE